MNFAEMGEALGLDADEFKELAELFVETATADADRLEAALSSVDANEAMEASHSIKGSSGNLGFMEISALAGEVEMKARKNDLSGLADSLARIRIGIEEIRAIC